MLHFSSFTLLPAPDALDLEKSVLGFVGELDGLGQTGEGKPLKKWRDG